MFKFSNNIIYNQKLLIINYHNFSIIDETLETLIAGFK